MSFKGTFYGKENWGHQKLLLIGLEWLALRVKKVAWKLGSFYAYWVMFVFCNLRNVWAFGFALPFSSFHGMGIVQTRVFARIAHWVPISAIPLSFHGLDGHTGPLSLLLLSLGFLGPFTSSLPLILSISLLAVILAMLTHWACYLFSWTSLTDLLHLYLLFFP